MSLKDKEEAKVYLQVLLLEVKSVIQNLEGDKGNTRVKKNRTTRGEIIPAEMRSLVTCNSAENAVLRPWDSAPTGELVDWHLLLE